MAIYISTWEGDNQLEINYIQTASKRQDHSVHQLHMRFIPANVCALVRGGGGGGGGTVHGKGGPLIAPRTVPGGPYIAPRMVRGDQLFYGGRSGGTTFRGDHLTYDTPP